MYPHTVAVSIAMMCFFCSTFQVLDSLTMDWSPARIQMISTGTSFFVGGMVMMIAGAILWMIKKAADRQSER